ncbi:hypothetical protein [Citrobacter meridianamericanus]|uniref:hypothetical protein n=1 Tax=Citrobacter meridianamericanus TaxID=2894201 RepID=UPI00351CCB9C
MNEPDIKKIRNKLGIPDEHKFLGYLILDTRKDDFLLSFTDNEYCTSKQWCAFPDLASKFDSYCKVVEIINHLEINDTAIIVMAFDLGSQVGVIPFEPEMMN